MVLAFVFSPLGIVFGVIARRQIRASGEAGRGLATAGLALGTAFTLLGTAAVTVLAIAVSSPSTDPAADSPTTIPAAEVAHMVDDQFDTQGSARTGATCPADLERIPGRSMQCALTVDEQPVDVTVTVASVDGGKVNYDFSSHARAIARQLLERKVTTVIAEKSGVKPDTTHCTGDLLPTVGEHVDCTLYAQGHQPWDLTATTTAVNGGEISWSLDSK